MSIEEVRQFLIYSLLRNYAILMIWFVAFVFGHSWMRRLHGRWFRLSESRFDAIHYSGMAVYKLGILLFDLVPLVVIWLMRLGD